MADKKRDGHRHVCLDDAIVRFSSFSYRFAGAFLIKWCDRWFEAVQIPHWCWRAGETKSNSTIMMNEKIQSKYMIVGRPMQDLKTIIEIQMNEKRSDA